MKHIFMVVFSAALLWGVCLADDDLDLKEDNVKFSYSLGYRIGGDISRRGVDVNPDLVLKGVQDAVTGNTPLLTSREMRSTLVNMNKALAAAREQKAKEQAEQDLEASLAFLKDNAKKEGIKTLSSGLQYRVIKQGAGRAPGLSDKVMVHYRGTLMDGTEFDSSYSRSKPAVFRVDGVIAGWTEALQLMKEGAQWQLFIPPELGYGNTRTGNIKPNSTLIFDVKLISVESSQ